MVMFGERCCSQVHANDVNGLGRPIMHTIDPAIGLNSLQQTFVEPPAQGLVRENPGQWDNGTPDLFSSELRPVTYERPVSRRAKHRP